MDDNTDGYGRGEYGEAFYGRQLPEYEIEIVGTNSPVDAGETLEVDAEVTNVGGPSTGEPVTLGVEEQ